MQLVDGKYYMYYNVCCGDLLRLVLGVVVVDNIEGLYKNKGIFLKLGMEGISDDGILYDVIKYLNVVDLYIFFDKNGKLWMVYGLYLGGIFIFEMNLKMGFLFSGQGYGKKLFGGNYSRIEGLYVFYNLDIKYYYLYLLYGGFDVIGGYNICVVCFKKFDGFYYDVEGNLMFDVCGKEGIVFDDCLIEFYGVKFMGSYFFEIEKEKGIGYVLSGYNFVYYDEKIGCFYLIFYICFLGRGEEYEVRVY